MPVRGRLCPAPRFAIARLRHKSCEPPLDVSRREIGNRTVAELRDTLAFGFDGRLVGQAIARGVRLLGADLEVVLSRLVHGVPARTREGRAVASDGESLRILPAQNCLSVSGRTVVGDPEPAPHIAPLTELAQHPYAGFGTLAVPEPQTTLQLDPVGRITRRQLFTLFARGQAQDGSCHCSVYFGLVPTLFAVYMGWLLFAQGRRI